MKPHCKHLATALAATLQLALHAAVPLAWDVRPGNPAPASFDRYHGEALEFRCTFRGFGELPFAPGADIRLWFQTNGMGSAWWSVPATISSNVLSATWSPALDPGAERVALFFGAPSNAYASAVLRLRHSPGFAPGSMPDPESFHESDPVFAEWLATNTLSSVFRDAIAEFATTGTTARALSYGTPTRWTDATGCVWDVREKWSVVPETFPSEAPAGFIHPIGLYAGKPIYLQPMYSSGSWWTPMCEYTPLGQGKGNEDSKSLSWSSDDAYFAITATYGLVTNLVGRVAITNDIPAAADLTPSTNYTDRALSSFAATGTVARARSYGTPTRWTDVTGCVWEVQTTRVCTHADEEWTYTVDGQTYTREQMIEAAGGVEDYSMTLKWLDSQFTNKDEENESFEGWYVVDGSGTAPVGYFYLTGVIPSYASDPYLAQVIYYGNITAIRGELVPVTNLVGRVALTNDIPAAPDLSPIEQEISDLRTESALVYRLYSGSNVVAEVTNYNSQVHAPELRLMQLNESNEYVTVWTETNGLARTLKRANEYTDDATGAVARAAAPRAWSRTTSGLGAEAPSNTTWISTPTTVIAGGFEYAKFVDTYGEVWVLTSNGMAAEFNPDTNAYFRITADDGTPVFSIEKSDAQLVGAHAAGITVGESTITIPVPVVSSTAPTMYWRSSLSSGDWADESAVNPNNMSVGWTGGPGSWVCTISFDGTRPSSMFFKFNFLQEGGVVIRNNATTDLSSGIYVNGVKFVPTVSGNNLIWTKQ